MHFEHDLHLQDNLSKLKKYGYEFIEPETGFLACGTSGKGRLADLNKIFDKTIKLLACHPADDSCYKMLFNKKIVVIIKKMIEYKITDTAKPFLFILSPTLSI